MFHLIHCKSIGRYKQNQTVWLPHSYRNSVAKNCERLNCDQLLDFHVYRWERYVAVDYNGWKRTDATTIAKDLIAHNCWISCQPLGARCSGRLQWHFSWISNTLVVSVLTNFYLVMKCFCRIEVKFVSDFQDIVGSVPMPTIAKDLIAINCWISCQPLRAICSGRLQWDFNSNCWALGIWNLKLYYKIWSVQFG